MLDKQPQMSSEKSPLSKLELLQLSTSSTAQGGGGSFKNEKPIGEVSCCGAKMAERTHWWIERWLSVSAFLSFSFSFSLSLSFAIYLQSLQSYLSSHLPILCVHLSMYLSICLSIYLSLYLSIYLIISLFIYITSEPPTVARTCGVLYILTWKCASRHSGAPFFNIRTSKSGANMWCFVHFDLEMCFAPQRRALFQHPNLQKWSEPGVFCTFWLGNVLRATTACTFSISEPRKVARTCRVLYILTSKCASRQNGVHFFNISTSKSGPRMVCFVHFDFKMCFAPQRRALFRHRNFRKWSGPGVFCTFWLQNVLRATTACNFSSLIWPTGSAPAALASLLFDPPEPQIIGKTQCFATFLPFRASASSFSDSFSSDLLSSNLSLLSASALLCFSSVHIVGSLTSKLPSINTHTFCSPHTWLYSNVWFATGRSAQGPINAWHRCKLCTKTQRFRAGCGGMSHKHIRQTTPPTSHLNKICNQRG